MADPTSVQVALRIRPLVPSEISRGCKDVVEVFPDLNQVRIANSDRAFSYNYVFGSSTTQAIFYTECVKDMIGNLFKGYNVTILAYGQTGSGKTHSMGTAYNGDGEMAVIPRAVHDIFNYVKDNFGYDFNITVSFMELYQEVLYDLLAEKSRDQCVVEIREDSKGIFIPNLTEKTVKSAYETLDCLAKGSLGRAVGSTNMNAQSSRSHAIFTINICMQKKDNSNFNKTAKFHLVDLAGSERSKKTGATGQTFKEGVNINKGLLALGNVISALGDEKLQGGYISYRDSNLTRLLKDSLGGNSITLMIACISPADYNLEESLSTLRYADRARKIKNKPIVNEDPKSAEINRLNKLVQQLRLELIGQGGPIICQAELELLKKENSDLKVKNRDLTFKLSSTLNENATLFERVLLIQTANENLQKKLLELREEYNVTLNNFNFSLESGDVTAIKENVTKLHTIQKHFTEIDSEQKKNQDELRRHEESCVRLPGQNNIDLSSETEINERQESHTANQIKLNNELQEITKNLAMKEHLAEKIAANTCYMVDYVAIAENEEKITALEKEKELLMQQLKSAHSTEVSSKIAEQRRKRVQELESQIHDLNKKVQEQARLIKLKDKDEQKIKQLNKEIVEMKQTKVKLIRNMKQESEKFRSWKLQRERDLIKLREQGRKRENEMIKMKTMHSRQQNVLRRKVEEAAAINKRLKDALALRKATQDSKNSGKIDRIGQWVQQELEIHISTLDAKATLQGLLEDRATLTAQLDALKADPDGTNSNEINQLEEDIELRSVQINDLQQKLCDSDEDEKAKTRWDNIQSMAEAKFALTTLFKLVATIRSKETSNEAKIADFQSIKAELEKQIEEQLCEMDELKMLHQQEVSNVERGYEEKVAVLLKQLRGLEVENKEDHMNQQVSILQEANEKLEKELEILKSENIELKQKLEEAVANQMKTPQPPPPKKDRKIKPPLPEIKTEDIIPPSPMNNSIEDDVDEDPDWQKTPLARRTRKFKSSLKPVQKERLSVKRTSEGGCNCKSTCAIKMCGCRKLNKPCTSRCRCKDDLCVNNKEKDTSGISETNENEPDFVTSEDDDSMIKKPRIPLDVIKDNDKLEPRTKKTRKLHS